MWIRRAAMHRYRVGFKVFCCGWSKMLEQIAGWTQRFVGWSWDFRETLENSLVQSWFLWLGTHFWVCIKFCRVRYNVRLIIIIIIIIIIIMIIDAALQYGARQGHIRCKARSHAMQGNITYGARQCHIRCKIKSLAVQGNVTYGARQCHIQCKVKSHAVQGNARQGKAMVSAPAWDGTGREFDSWQCRIYIPCSLSLRLLGSFRGSLGTYGL